MGEARALNDRLQEMLDHHDIRNLLSTYCHGCDRGDGAMMAGVYAEGSWDDHGRYKGTGQGFTEQVMRQFIDEGARCVHLLGQALIEVNDNRAAAESYFLATIFTKDAHGEEVLTLLGGRYIDTLQRDAEGWKIKSRVAVRDWSRKLDATIDPLANDNFVEGKMSGDDPSYAALNLQHSGLQSWLAGRRS
jgi:hypothetical protein